MNFYAIAGAEARSLHEQLLNTQTLQEQLSLLDAFLLKRFATSQRKKNKFEVANNVIAEFKEVDLFENMEGIASRYGISARYLHKLFVEFTGLNPKLYHKINRFQKSLMLTGKQEESLTSIAYLCGYFDQSHFVRDFRFFTEGVPSAFDPKGSSAMLVSPNKF